MSKFSRHERKIYKEGRDAGYIEGYKDGLHDGNPFTVAIEAIAKFVDNLTKLTPEQLEALAKNEDADLNYSNLLEDIEEGEE